MRTGDHNAGGGGGVILRWISIPSRGSRNIPVVFILLKSELSAGDLTGKQTLPFLHTDSVTK